MKKTASKKTTKQAKAAPRAVAVTPVAKPAKQGSSFSLYVYWFIILFFIAATFYILGRSHGALTNRGGVNNVEVTEEELLMSNDYYEMGKNAVVAGNLDEAMADLNAAIAADATNVNAFILRGEVYMQSGDYANAAADFAAALEVDPANSIAYYDSALLNTRLEDYNAALNDINAALAARVENPNEILQLRDLYAKRGQLNLWLKNWQGAIADYTNSLARPDGIVSPDVYAERAEAYTAVGDYASAIADYASAVRVISEQIQGVADPATQEHLNAQAMSYFEKSAALNLNLGDANAAMADLENARTIAMALNDVESVDRLTGLMQDMSAIAQ